MKTTKFYGAYEAPAVEMVEVAIEKGFAASGDTEKPGFGEY